MKDGDCLGGYTQESWSTEYAEKSDRNAMILNISKRKVFPVIPNGKYYSTKCKEYLGPSFGEYNLSAYHEPFNTLDACWAWSSGPNRSYSIKVSSDDIHELTGLQKGANCWFTINELEVWGISEVYYDSITKIASGMGLS
jgi:hypothetical protein